MSSGDQNWLAMCKANLNQRPKAASIFWPSFQKICKEYAEEEPFKNLVRLHAEEDDPHTLILSAGLFDLKIAVDVLSNTVFYAFTSRTLKKIVPKNSGILATGCVKLTIRIWGVIDLPNPRAPQTFVGPPQEVEYFPFADRFARWCYEHLAGGYDKIIELEQEAADKQANCCGTGAEGI